MEYEFTILNCHKTTIILIFWNFLMFYQIFLSPKRKQCVIITSKHELPHKLLNNLKLRILGN